MNETKFSGLRGGLRIRREEGRRVDQEGGGGWPKGEGGNLL